MSSVEDFLQNPSDGLLDVCTKDELIKLAEHFEIEIPGQARKDHILCVVKENLVQSGVLSESSKGTDFRNVTPQVTFPKQSL